jgi:DNA-binding XRE family transcriptional regulator/predicted RNase H-like HicB family nuclease
MRHQAFVTRDGQFTVVALPHCPGCLARVPAGEDVRRAAIAALDAWLEAQLANGGAPLPPFPLRRRVPAGARVMSVPVSPLLAVRIQLRWARRTAGLSQRDLAVRLGVSQQQVAQTESGIANLTLARLVELAHATGHEVEISLISDSGGRAFPGPDWTPA